MRRLSLPIASVISLLAIALLVPALRANAATTPAPTQETGQALEIAPPVINLAGNPGETIRTEINLRDVAKGKIRVTAEFNDFVASGEDGVPKILLNTEEESPYSMRSWISPLPELILSPQEIKKMPVAIHIPANAAPGGYYGVIRFTAAAPDLDSTGVSLSASLGSLVLLKVNGAAKEQLSIESFTVNTIPGGKFDLKESGTAKTTFEETPIQFVERIRNSGNIHETPAGQVIIKNMFGKVVATVNVNLPPRNILPGSIRKFSQPLDSGVIGNKRLFGKYTAELKLTYGASKQTVSKTVTFWVIPYKLIIGGILGIILAFFIFRTLLRNYNKRVIEKARKRSRRR